MTKQFELYISKLLKDSNGGNISSNSKQQLSSALSVIAIKISELALTFVKISKKKTCSAKQVESAVKVFFKGELEKAITYANKAVETFQDGIKIKGKSSRQSKAGIVFPVSLCERYLRQDGYTNILLTNTSSIFLTACLEYFTMVFLKNIDNKGVRITIRDLELCMQKTPDIKHVFTFCNIHLIGGGVVPYIDESLKNKKRRKKNDEQILPEDEQKVRKYRPGTVCLREIKKMQKSSNCLILPKMPFENMVKGILKEIIGDFSGCENEGKEDGKEEGKEEEKENEDTTPSLKFSKDFFIVLQYDIEQYITQFLKECNTVAIHSDRIKITPSDIRLISVLRGGKDFKKANPEESKPEATHSENIKF